MHGRVLCIDDEAKYSQFTKKHVILDIDMVFKLKFDEINLYCKIYGNLKIILPRITKVLHPLFHKSLFHKCKTFWVLNRFMYVFIFICIYMSVNRGFIKPTGFS